MNTKAQAAMEFLMTYGWAILVVLAAIAALAYFGVLSPNKFIPDQCILESGVACVDFSVSSTQTDIILVNSLGRDLILSDIHVGECNKTLNQNMGNGQQLHLVLDNCDNGETGTKFKGNVIVNYINADSSLNKQVTGSLTTKIQ
jgi:uncharacterized protein (UPF0333 family)